MTALNDSLGYSLDTHPKLSEINNLDNFSGKKERGWVNPINYFLSRRDPVYTATNAVTIHAIIMVIGLNGTGKRLVTLNVKTPSTELLNVPIPSGPVCIQSIIHTRVCWVSVHSVIPWKVFLRLMLQVSSPFR